MNLQTKPPTLRPAFPVGRSTIEKSHIETIADGKLYALQNVMELDGRVSAYPANARGYSVSNCYLIKEGDRALLLDSGLSAHEASIIAQIRSLTTPDTLLSVFPLRINEYMSVCNVEAIAQNFNVEQCYSGNPDAALWVDFGRRSDANDSRPYSLKTTLVSRAETLHVGDGRAHRRVPGADPPDQHPLDVRPEHQDAVHVGQLLASNGATVRTDRGRSPRTSARPRPATSAASC